MRKTFEKKTWTYFIMQRKWSGSDIIPSLLKEHRKFLESFYFTFSWKNWTYIVLFGWLIDVPNCGIKEVNIVLVD